MTSYLASISENTWILIIGQAVLALGMIIKAWVDSNNRIQDRLDAEMDAKIAQLTKEEIKLAGAVREAKILAKIEANTELTHEVKAVAVESVKKADKAYNEANNVNVKLTSMGIQTKPALGETAANPVHTITP